MEKARERGLARSIGVFNFGTRELEEVTAAGTVPPAVNQVQFGPFDRRALLDACPTAECRGRGLQLARHREAPV